MELAGDPDGMASDSGAHPLLGGIGNERAPKAA